MRNSLKLAMRIAASFFLLVALAAPGQAAGPVILGGDDLTDHGSRSGSDNVDGWLYIENAISSINAQATRPGPYTTDIAAIGSADPGAGNYPSSDAGGAINSVANVLGLTVTFYDGDAAITTFFAGLAAGTINPKIIWLAGDGADNDLSSSEIAVVDANAAALNSFVASGGGLMSHGDSDVYGWLTALLPGIILSPDCDADPGATLTAAGIAAFPTLTNDDINAGPCHNSFSGNLGNLTVLALDEGGRAFIIGGLIGPGGIGGCPTHVHGHTFPFGHGDPGAHGFGHIAEHPAHGHHFVCADHAPGHTPFALQADTAGDLRDSGFVAALNQNNSLNGAIRAPRGTVLQFFGWAAGLFVGDQDEPAIRFTAPASGVPLYTTTTPGVLIGGAPAKVLFSGMAPGLTGVWQVNVLIPEEAPSGNSVPVTVLHQGRTVRSVEVAIE